ncbi:MAG: hypothetical protein HDQ88_06420 [Clostridia bacterium]|nr:hypothetical protein [Clostridia bacterium]
MDKVHKVWYNITKDVIETEFTFDRNGFLNHMIDQFPMVMSNHFTHDLVENVVDLVIESHGEDVDDFVRTLAKNVPELEPEEVCLFVEKKK